MMVKVNYFFVLMLILGIFLLSGCVQQTEQPSTVVPTDKESCEAQGAKWEAIGLFPEEECNLPTSDAGKECSNSDECEGSCIADLSKEDFEKAIDGIVYTNGKCTAWKIIVGCNAFVEDGKVEGIVCID